VTLRDRTHLPVVAAAAAAAARTGAKYADAIASAAMHVCLSEATT
jgi:hypothetical protein